MKLDPIGWIGNFQPDEQKLARRLLKNFLYFSQIMTEEMFKSNFQSLSKYILTDKSNFEEYNTPRKLDQKIAANKIE
jgi:hypothetical protein